MTNSALFLAGSFTLVVEGTLPDGTGYLLEPFTYVEAYYVSLVTGLCLMFASIMLAMAMTSRMSIFMVTRTSKQQAQLRKPQEPKTPPRAEAPNQPARFQPRRIPPEDVPPGYRVVSTPFGDRLVEQ